MHVVKNMNSLPPMPEDGDIWSVMPSWVLPTRSFLEVFVLCCRMLLDSLDAQIYEEHHQTNRCYLILSHFYSWLLELITQCLHST
ncbi:unnamed protein product [Brassica rapa subsp. trilocularis]